MGAYLDRLNAEFDEITSGITALVERAADESRDLTPAENEQIEREDKRRDELTRAIEHHTTLEERAGKVAALRSRVAPSAPVFRSAGAPTPAEDPRAAIAREFPTAGHYAAMLVKSGKFRSDPGVLERAEAIARANQTTADNPGIIPRPIVGDLLGQLQALRPMVSSVPNPSASVGSFDRPIITQHVQVGKQAAEKQPLPSRQMTIGKVPVALDTFGGFVNVSRQDLKWTSPAILQVLFSDFTAVYAQETDAQACLDFVAGCTNTAEIPGAPGASTAADFEAALRDAVATIGTQADNAVPDTLWMSPDMWSTLGGATVGTSGVKAYNLPLTGGGDVLGLRPVLDFQFPAGTLIVGVSRLAECWEDLDGFLSVDEPSIHGQEVAYAGYFDTVVLDADGFIAFTNAA